MLEHTAIPRSLHDDKACSHPLGAVGRARGGAVPS
jgi:hypothetical protein